MPGSGTYSPSIFISCSCWPLLFSKYYCPENSPDPYNLMNKPQLFPHKAAILGNKLNSLDNRIIVSSYLCLPYQTILSFIHLVALYEILWQLWRGNRNLKYIKGIICLFNKHFWNRSSFPDSVKALRNDKLIKVLLSFLLIIRTYIYFLPQNRHCVRLFTYIYSFHDDKKKARQLLCPFYREENRDSKRLSNLFNIFLARVFKS